jgi:hypothetical protein
MRTRPNKEKKAFPKLASCKIVDRSKIFAGRRTNV